MRLSAVVLAGGQSRRMGRDKAWLEIGGKTLLARQLELACAGGAAEIFISGRADRDYSEFAHPVLLDRISEAGPLAGMERAFAAMTSSHLLVLAVDMQNLTAAMIRKLARHCADTRGIIPRVDGRIEPLAAVYPRVASDLSTFLLDRGFYAATTFAERCVQCGLAGFLDLPAKAAGFFASCNRPADLDLAASGAAR